MFNPTEVVIDAFVERLQAHYLDTYGRLEPDYPNMLGYLGRLALEIIANSDAPYHNTDPHHQGDLGRPGDTTRQTPERGRRIAGRLAAFHGLVVVP